MMSRRALGEWAVLGLLTETAAHPFALARQLGVEGSPGRVLTVRKPLVYRAVERLDRDELIERHRTEPGDAGPDRTVYRVTPRGRAALDAWLDEPVDHVRDLRLAFLLKIVLLQRLGRSPGPLVRAQRNALAPALNGLALLPDDPDEIDLWRHHNAAATAAFLDDLVGRFAQ
jgi:PadR family transcriptional regulator AphA